MAKIQRRGGDAAPEPLRGVDGAVVIEMVEDQAELVRAGAREQVGGADQPGQRSRGMDEGSVAPHGAVRPLDFVKAGNCDRKHRGAGAVTAGDPRHPLQRAGEAPPVGEAGEAIGFRPLLIFPQAALGVGKGGAKHGVFRGRVGGGKEVGRGEFFHAARFTVAGVNRPQRRG